MHRLAQQLQPHFLFNALNTVSALMHSDVERADATLARLAEVLRAALELGERPATALADELRLARGYADIMGERFADRVAVSWQVEARALACQVPVMSLQPLLENIFKHTVERRRGRTAIAVSAAVEGQHLLLRLDDDAGLLAPGPRPGIALDNLRQRLRALHGDQASLTLTQLSPAGVRTELRLPCGC